MSTVGYVDASTSGSSRDETVVDVERLTVRFGGVRALNDVSFAVRAGEIHGLIGPNGAGKSTLVKVISGAERRGQSKVRLFGEPTLRTSSQQRARKGLGCTFQKPALFESLTIQENLGLARKRARSVSSECAQWIDGLQSEVGLTRWLEMRAGDAPYPVQKLVDVVRAISLAPTVLLVDEPAGGLNADERELLAELLLRARDRLECSIILIEHDVPMVFRVCDRVTVLSNGSAIVNGMTPDDVRQHPEVVSAYLGTPA
ncbi:ABC transporter ATP-binding protein [Rhodococcus koreensis]